MLMQHYRENKYSQNINEVYCLRLWQGEKDDGEM